MEDFMNDSVNILLLPLCFLGLYMILEAMDWGLSLSAPLVSRNKEEDKAILGLMRPCLDGNELWFFLGLFMFSYALPTAKETMEGIGVTLLLTLVSLGALFRCISSLLRNKIASPLLMKGLSAFSFLSLGLMGFVSTSFLLGQHVSFSVVGLFCALWFVLSAFQLGSLYGAVKAVNPLAERFRAAFLVSSVISVISYIIFAILLKTDVGDSHVYGSFFWTGLVATAILFVVSFLFTRMRHVKVGLTAAYLSSFFGISIYLSAFAVKIPELYFVKLGAVKAALDAGPATAFLVLAIVWTVGAFIWRHFRKKESYEWKDRI